MRVLIIPSEYFVPPESPLAGIFQYDQAVALRKAGVQVDVVAPQLRSLRGLLRPRQWLRRGFERGVVDGIDVYRWHGWHWSVPPAGLGRAAVWLRTGRKLVRRYLSTNRAPDVVHVHNARYAGMLGPWIRRTYGLPYVITEHSSAYLLGAVPRRELAGIRAAYAEASERFVVSEALGEAVEAVVGPAAQARRVLPNLLDAQFEDVTLDGVPDRSPFRFLNVAELNANKRHADLLDAFAAVARGRDCELRIVGDGPLAGALRARSAALGIQDRVRFMGRLDRSRVKEEMLACHAFVLTSRRETFGVALAEALACGRPVVATASGGPNSMVTPPNGFLVPPADVAALTRALTSMIDEYPRFDPTAIRQQCLERYGSEHIVKTLIDTYHRVSGQRAA